MDVNLIFSVFFAIILTMFILEFDEGIILILIGFLTISLAINLDTAFSITSSSYQGFGQLIQLVYAFVAIFAFAKTYYTGKAQGVDFMFGWRVKKNG